MLDAAHREAIETRLNHNAAGTEPAQNPALVDELATQMTGTPHEFARRDLIPTIAQSPMNQWQRFRDWQPGLRRNDPVTEDQLYAIKRGLQLTAKLLPSDMPDDGAANYRAELVEEIDRWRRINGKSPNDAEIVSMLRRYAVPPKHIVRTLEGSNNPSVANAENVQFNNNRGIKRPMVTGSSSDLIEEKLRSFGPVPINPIERMMPGGTAGSFTFWNPGGVRGTPPPGTDPTTGKIPSQASGGHTPGLRYPRPTPAQADAQAAKLGLQKSTTHPYAAGQTVYVDPKTGHYYQANDDRTHPGAWKAFDQSGASLGVRDSTMQRGFQSADGTTPQSRLPTEFTFLPLQLQEKSKHGPDFGVHSRWNKAYPAIFEKALRDHMTAPGTVAKFGT